MEKNLLLKEIKGHVGTLVFNRPEKRNALTVDMLLDLAGTLDEWAKDDSIRVVVITGAGDKAFCGGFDVLSIPTELKAEDRKALQTHNAVERALSSVKGYPYPTIAMLNGYAMGAGFNIAMCCDIRVAADHVRMGMPPARLGLVYHPEGVKQVVEAIGMARAREVFFTGRLYGAEDVRKMGLVHHMVQRAELESFTYNLAQEISENAPLSLKGIKRILNMLSESLRLSDDQMNEAALLVAQAFMSEDLKEGQTAFIQKRKPEFKGK